MSKYVSKNSKVLIEFFNDMASISYNYRIPKEVKFIEDPVILNLVDTIVPNDFIVRHVKLSSFYCEDVLKLKLYLGSKELEIWSSSEVSIKEAIDLIKNSL